MKNIKQQLQQVFGRAFNEPMTADYIATITKHVTASTDDKLSVIVNVIPDKTYSWDVLYSLNGEVDESLYGLLIDLDVEEEEKKELTKNLQNKYKKVTNKLENVFKQEDVYEAITKRRKQMKINEDNVEYFLDKYKYKMRGSSKEVAMGWVDGIGELSKKEREEIKRKIIVKYFENQNYSFKKFLKEDNQKLKRPKSGTAKYVWETFKEAKLITIKGAQALLGATNESIELIKNAFNKREANLKRMVELQAIADEYKKLKDDNKTINTTIDEASEKLLNEIQESTDIGYNSAIEIGDSVYISMSLLRKDKMTAKMFTDKLMKHFEKDEKLAQEIQDVYNTLKYELDNALNVKRDKRREKETKKYKTEVAKKGLKITDDRYIDEGIISDSWKWLKSLVSSFVDKLKSWTGFAESTKNDFINTLKNLK